MFEQGQKVCIGIPTINSGRYIYHSLVRYYDELECFDSNFRLEVVLCINGKDENDNIYQQIKSYFLNYSKYNVTILEEPEEGKNKALNKILKYARDNEFTFIHFIDDDVDFLPGSLSNNINYLNEKSRTFPYPILVGSNFQVKKHALRDYIRKSKSKLKGTRQYLLYKIFSTPFSQQSDAPNFCLGGSLCGYLETFPNYPEAMHDIADDGFICNFFSVQAFKETSDTDVKAIFKPADSIMYFQVPTNIKEWMDQQVRIYTGVLNAYLYYPEFIDFFQKQFSWTHNFDKSWRSPTHYNFEMTLRTLIHRSLQKVIVYKSRKHIRKSLPVQWNVSESTKEYL